MRVLLIVAAIAAASPAVADSTKRALIVDMLADASASAGLCPEVPGWTLNGDVATQLFLAGNFAASEQQQVVDRMKVFVAELRERPGDVVCRDLKERYGPEGSVVQNLLVPR